MPVRPVPNKSKVAGSGTAVCCALVICPVSATVLPGSMETSLTLKTKEPTPQVVCWPGMPPLGSGSQFGSLKVNKSGVLLKSTNTPPMLSLTTVPVTIAEKVAELEPLMPWGAVKVTKSVKGVLKVFGAVLRVIEPRLLKFAPGFGAAPIPLNPFAVVPAKVELLKDNPATVALAPGAQAAPKQPLVKPAIKTWSA